MALVENVQPHFFLKLVSSPVKLSTEFSTHPPYVPILSKGYYKNLFWPAEEFTFLLEVFFWTFTRRCHVSVNTKSMSLAVVEVCHPILDDQRVIMQFLHSKPKYYIIFQKSVFIFMGDIILGSQIPCTQNRYSAFNINLKKPCFRKLPTEFLIDYLPKFLVGYLGYNRCDKTFILA